ncbi:hypothetical protein AB0L14_05515 [Streptomyces sp. NPDC052727]|uniref:hypothetical protein n=1 Tax=Streptomyces sp. NPDC052727 TaxID=3154854 RepID=UPI003412F688
MGASRRIRRRSRVMAVAGLVVVGGGAVAACQPGGGLGSATVAYTTDQTATAALEHRHVNVSWLSCTGSYGDDGARGGSPAPSETTVVSVDCQGETDDGRKIVVAGLVTKAVDGACVRGDLTAKVDGRQVFRVDGLGNCSATRGPTYRLPTGGQPTVTVTVTRTVWPVPGK